MEQWQRQWTTDLVGEMRNMAKGMRDEYPYRAERIGVLCDTLEARQRGLDEERSRSDHFRRMGYAVDLGNHDLRTQLEDLLGEMIATGGSAYTFGWKLRAILDSGEGADAWDEPWEDAGYATGGYTLASTDGPPEGEAWKQAVRNMVQASYKLCEAMDSWDAEITEASDGVDAWQQAARDVVQAAGNLLDAFPPYSRGHLTLAQQRILDQLRQAHKRMETLEADAPEPEQHVEIQHGALVVSDEVAVQIQNAVGKARDQWRQSIMTVRFGNLFGVRTAQDKDWLHGRYHGMLEIAALFGLASEPQEHDDDD